MNLQMGQAYRLIDFEYVLVFENQRKSWELWKNDMKVLCELTDFQGFESL
jgi:hypothetical protein